MCSIGLWTWLLLHKISSWNNQILESYLPLYARIMDVDIYFYFYDNTYFIHCKDTCCKIGIIGWFYRRNNIISIQVSQISKVFVCWQKFIVLLRFCVQDVSLEVWTPKKQNCFFFGTKYCLVGLQIHEPLTLINFFTTYQFLEFLLFQLLIIIDCSTEDSLLILFHWFGQSLEEF